MAPEHEPQQPSIREVVEKELQLETQQWGQQFEGRSSIDTLYGKIEGQEAIREYTEKQVLLGYLNNFPRKLPDSNGNTKKVESTVAGKSSGEFAQDVLKAIRESGVDEQALRQYIDRLNTGGLLDFGALKPHRELVFPVFIKLLEMGYSKSDLAR